MDESGGNERLVYTWSGGGEDVAETLDGADEMVSVRDGDMARSKSGGGSVWNVFRTVERGSSCLSGEKVVVSRQDRAMNPGTHEPCS